MANTNQGQQYNQIPQYNNAITAGGKFVQVWYRFFNGLLTGLPPADVSVVGPTPSPFHYGASQRGFMVVQGGTVQMISITRGAQGSPVNTGVTQGPIPLSSGDTLTVVYTARPNMTFFPQ